MVVVLPEAEEQKNQINDEAAIFVDIIDRILFQFLSFLFFPWCFSSSGSFFSFDGFINLCFCLNVIWRKKGLN